MNELSVADAAYIAGLIDADGTVSCSPRKTGREGFFLLPAPLVCIFNSDLPLMHWLMTTIGAGRAYEYKSAPSRPREASGHWNVTHRYQASGRDAQDLLLQVRQYMRVKALQADLVMSLPARGRDFRSRATDEMRQRAHVTFDQIRFLNRRGHRPWMSMSPEEREAAANYG